MNTIKVKIDFEKRKNSIIGVDLTSGDYNSTKMIFDFDREDGIKVFELKNPKGELVFSKEIENNEIILTKIEEDGTFSSIFDMAGDYIFEVSLYANEGKLTSDYAYLPVEPEQVIIGDTISEPYLPIFDELIQKLNNAITETNNLDINMENSVITITKKDGTQYSENVKGDKGEKGDAGSIKFIIVNELPSENIDESAIYMKRVEIEESQNTYEEYIYVNGTWELLGTAQVQVDLTDYVKNTDYATEKKGGVVIVTQANGLYMGTSGNIGINKATNTDIDAKKNHYKPIVPSNLNYAVKSVVGGHETLTQTEYDKLVANGTYTKEDGTVLTYSDDDYYNIVAE